MCLADAVYVFVALLNRLMDAHTKRIVDPQVKNLSGTSLCHDKTKLIHFYVATLHVTKVVLIICYELAYLFYTLHH